MTDWFWSQKEIDILRDNYKSKGGEETAKLLPKRSLNAVHQMAQKLGCARKTRKWANRAERDRNCILKSKYGIDLEQYNEMLLKQKGLCAICGLPSVDRNQWGMKSLAVDHNHVTGEIRGLLCSKCNRAIGLLLVDKFGVMNLQKAISYLKGGD